MGSVAGGVTSFFTNIAAGEIGRKQAHFERDVALINEAAALSESASMAALADAEGRARIGRARALAGASGFTLEGSALDVIGQLAATANFNSRSAIYQGRRRAQQARADAEAAQQRGRASRFQGISRGVTALTQGLSGGSPSGSDGGGSMGSSMAAAAMAGG